MGMTLDMQDLQGTICISQIQVHLMFKSFIGGQGNIGIETMLRDFCFQPEKQDPKLSSLHKQLDNKTCYVKRPCSDVGQQAVQGCDP